jgi:hypothetical protein
MLTRVEVRTRQGTLLNLPLEDAESGYAIEEIEGLDPVNAILVSSSIAGRPGEHFHTSKREKRNLKMKVKFEPDFDENTVKSLRNRLYSFLMPEAEAMMRFHDTDGSYVDIVGIVESNEAPLFTDEPGADVSLVCFEPDFFDPNPITVSGTSTSSVDQFTTIEYFGTVESGILFRFMVDRPIDGFTIIHVTPANQTRQLEFAASLIAGDLVTISTIPGAKGATLTRANTISSLLYGVSPMSNWITLKQGTNRLRVALAGDAVPFEVQYVTRYGGL